MDKKKESAGKELRISCMSAANIIAYFTKRRKIPLEKIIDGMSVSYDYLTHTGNWINNNDAYILFRNCQKAAGDLRHRDWKYIGNEIYAGNAPGYFKVLFGFLPLDKIFEKIPEYGLRVSRLADFEIISSKPGEITYAYRMRDPIVRQHYLTGAECSYTLGVVSAVSKVKNEFKYETKARHEICSMPIPVLLENVYGVDSSRYYYDKEGFHLDGKLVGKWVKLKSNRDNHRYLSKHFDFCEEELADAVIFISDVELNGTKALRQGYIYDAPYCIFNIKYKKRFYIGEKLNKQKMIIFLENQLKLTEDKVRETMEAKQEAERQIEEVNKRDEAIGVFMKKSILDEFAAGKNPMEFKPIRKKTAILFTDIRNFTDITEKFDAMHIVEFLNAFFTEMTHPIKGHGGEFDKLMGDSIMAVFDDNLQAVKAAVQMQKILRLKGDEILPSNKMGLKMGVGIHFDEVIAGNIGDIHTKMDRTIIGDGVNLASRLESLTKHYRTDVLISGQVEKGLMGEISTRYVDLIQVKGKSQPILIYEVLDCQEDEIREIKQKTLGEYRGALDLYMEGEFAKSLEAFEKLRDKAGEDKDGHCLDAILDVYIERLNDFITLRGKKVSRKEWDGVFRHMEK